jgi:hypothetical protein
MAFQRKKPAAIKAPYPGFIEPALANVDRQGAQGRALDP